MVDSPSVQLIKHIDQAFKCASYSSTLTNQNRKLQFVDFIYIECVFMT